MSPATLTLVSRLHLTAPEAEAVRVGAERTAAIWEACFKAEYTTNRFNSPAGMPTAEEAIVALGCHWKRQASLLDLVLVMTAELVGHPMSGFKAVS